VANGPIGPSTEYLLKLNAAGDAFEPIVQFLNAAEGIAGFFVKGAAFTNKLYFFAGTGSDRPIYVYNGTGVPTLVGGLATFTSDFVFGSEPLSITSNGLYFKPMMGAPSSTASNPVDQDYVVIRSDGSVESVDVGDMTESSGQVFEAHGFEYILGTYGSQSGAVLKLNAPA